MGAEKHVDRPGRGGGRKMGLDPSAIRRRGRRERLYCNWFVAKVRAQGADKLHQMQQFWLQSAWRIAMGMRSGRTFGEVTQEIRSDLPSLQKPLAMPSPEKRSKGSSSAWDATAPPWRQLARRLSA